MNDKLTLHIASNRKHATNLPVWQGNWSGLCELYKNHCVMLPITRREYEKLPDKQRKEMKDVGGIIPAILSDGRRRNDSTVARDFVSLDIDSAPHDFLERYKRIINKNAIIHTTASSTPEHPRYRVLIPLMERIGAADYSVVAQKVIDMLGLTVGDDAADDVSLVPCQLMYWPACCKDEQVTLICFEGDGFLSVHDLPSSLSKTNTEGVRPETKPVAVAQPSAPMKRTVVQTIPQTPADYKSVLYDTLRQTLGITSNIRPITRDTTIKQHTFELNQDDNTFFTELAKDLPSYD